MPFKSSLLWVVVYFAAYSFPTVAAEPLETVDELLQKASKALQEKNYSGRFTYEFGSTLETLEIVHAVKDGIELERVSHLNGVKREFLRSGHDQNCVSSGGLLLRGGLISTGGGAVSLSQNYHFYVRGDERIAGREASVIQAVPKDQFRFGVTLAIDKSSGLPLMSMFTSENRTALERFQFVQLTVGDPIDPAKLEPIDDRFTRLDGRSEDCGRPGTSNSSWHASWLPSGFVLSHSSKEGSVDTLTYTDGLASFTLFISAKGEPQTVKRGLARRGATTALMTALSSPDGVLSIVLVGEVPTQTAYQVVSSIRPSLQ